MGIAIGPTTVQSEISLYISGMADGPVYTMGEGRCSMEGL